LNRPRPVLTKHDFVQRFLQGEFGNALKAWPDFGAWCEANLGESKLKRFHIRNRQTGGRTWYDVPKYNMTKAWMTAVSRVENPDLLYISEMVDHTQNVLQGEVQQLPDGRLSLFCSRARGADQNMRTALATSGEQMYGIKALTVLRTLMDRWSYDWLDYLLETYPGHVVEFTTLRASCGVLNRPTLFWEVRRY
jgi:hypothetical protein